MTVAIIPAVEGGAFLAIGDTLTIFDAAMIYAGRHPASAFLRDAELAEAEQFLGRGSRGEDEHATGRRLSWDIYCELKRRVKSGEIKPVCAAYLSSDENDTPKIDPLRTTISIACLAELARERGDKPEFLAQLIEEPPPRTGAAGRPSMSRELLEPEMKARAARGELKPSLREEVSELLPWLEREHPTWPCPKPGTAKNNLRKAYNQLKASTK
jgi:hypothetical protein